MCTILYARALRCMSAKILQQKTNRAKFWVLSELLNMRSTENAKEDLAAGNCLGGRATRWSRQQLAELSGEEMNSTPHQPRRVSVVLYQRNRSQRTLYLSVWVAFLIHACQNQSNMQCINRLECGVHFSGHWQQFKSEENLNVNCKTSKTLKRLNHPFSRTPIAILELVRLFDHRIWCSEKFVDIFNGSQTTNRHYWKQYHPRCAGGKRETKGAITSKIIKKHAIKHKTSPARLAELLQPLLAFCFSLKPMTAHWTLRRYWLQAKTKC